MEPHAQRDLKILTELARGAPVTQRGLAEQLGIAEKSRLGRDLPYSGLRGAT